MFSMKKNVGVIVLSVLYLAALSSCKKDYVCQVDGVTISSCTACDSSDKSSLETSCSVIGGTVSVK